MIQATKNLITTKKENFDLQLNNSIIDAIQDVKGRNVVLMDLINIDEAPCDYFILCEGTSTIHVRSISDSIIEKVRNELNTKPYHREGMNQSMSKWILVDFFNTVVHIFHSETRNFYDLEDLWNDAEFKYYEDVF